VLTCAATIPLEDVSIFVELESGGPPPEACRVVGVGQPPSRTDEGPAAPRRPPRPIGSACYRHPDRRPDVPTGTPQWTIPAASPTEQPDAAVDGPEIARARLVVRPPNRVRSRAPSADSKHRERSAGTSTVVARPYARAGDLPPTRCEPPDNTRVPSNGARLIVRNTTVT
jgi:hypothetical protein